MKYTLIILSISILFFGCKTKTQQSDAFGNFEAETTIVSAETPGKILQFNIEKGQQIESNFVTAIIDTVQLKIQLKQIDAQKQSIESRRASIQSQIAILTEQKTNLKINEDRITKMLADGASTQKKLDDIQGQIKVIDKQIASTQTQFTSVAKEVEVLNAQKLSINDQLNRCKVKSPISGMVLETYARLGEMTTPGKPLFKMADLSELELKVYISGAVLPNIKIGQTVDVLIDKTATENQTLSGKVTWISSEAEFTPKIIQTKEERVKLVYAVIVMVKNDGTLKIGMPGEILF